MDPGDFVVGPYPEASRLRSELSLAGIKAMRYDVIGLGGRELWYGPSAFLEIADDAIPVAASNLVQEVAEGVVQPVAPTYLIRDLDHVRVGVFALSGPELPGFVRNSRPEYALADPVMVTESVLTDFAAADVDVIVLLSQLERTSLTALLAQFPEIDVAVLGHPTTKYRDLRRLKGFDTVLAASGGLGRNLVRVTLTVSPDGVVLDRASDLIQVKPYITPEPNLKVQMNEVDVMLAQLGSK